MATDAKIKITSRPILTGTPKGWLAVPPTYPITTKPKEGVRRLTNPGK